MRWLLVGIAALIVAAGALCARKVDGSFHGAHRAGIGASARRPLATGRARSTLR